MYTQSITPAPRRQPDPCGWPPAEAQARPEVTALPSPATLWVYDHYDQLLAEESLNQALLMEVSR